MIERRKHFNAEPRITCVPLSVIGRTDLFHIGSAHHAEALELGWTALLVDGESVLMCAPGEL